MSEKIIIEKFTFSQMIDEARKFSPDSNDIMALLFYYNHLYAVNKYASDLERRIAASRKLTLVGSLYNLFYERRN